MSAGPKIERRYRGLSREELGQLIRREARAALRIVAPMIKPGTKAKRPGPGRGEPSAPNWKDRRGPSPVASAAPKAAVVKIPREPIERAKALIAKRESICAGCEHFNGVCTLVFQQVKGCRSVERYRAGWFAWLSEVRNVCPVGLWTANQE